MKSRYPTIDIYGQYANNCNGCEDIFHNKRRFISAGYLGNSLTHRHSAHSVLIKRGGREMKWPAFEAPYFLFSEQFSYLYGYRDGRVRFNKLNKQQRPKKNLLAIPMHEWSRKNYFISPQLFVYMFSGIWTSDSHKYTKNVCMTGHNIKYHQNKRNKMEELEGFSPSSPRPTPPVIDGLVFCVSEYPHISPNFSPCPAKISRKRTSCMLPKKKQDCGIKTCSGETERHCGGLNVT